MDGSKDDVVWKDDITDSESSVDYESESDRDLNYNDADILTNEQMDHIPARWCKWLERPHCSR